ncbi:Hydrogenase nickel incorporation protein hypA [Desulfamplus magnetovallimortis]|uniref:Hydrogenase maturation factor HypA n=1 Tax=Desulfamplus magnetovallimortis TaxID=1246637 RepID=A0A1W1HA78_9BACT|nr:hydrogenase maturation nickel metallochaperone HypA [Desulfamplus magnetovallimortis]SLM29305.1 Hydrogenase nickel incorporation protein hypA [Desulfamplus magnetovallimortis]
MHEMGVAQQMVNIAIASIPSDIVNPKVEKLNLRIGNLAAVVEDSLKFCFEIITKDTSLEGAKLVIEKVPVVVKCKACAHQWEVDGPVFTCPSCRDGAVEILSGRELEISSLELAD